MNERKEPTRMACYHNNHDDDNTTTVPMYLYNVRFEWCAISFLSKQTQRILLTPFKSFFIFLHYLLRTYLVPIFLIRRESLFYKHANLTMTGIISYSFHGFSRQAKIPRRDDSLHD